MSTTKDLTEWSCTKCTLSDNPKSSKCEMCSKKRIIIDLMYDLNDNAEYINPFMAKIMNHFNNINNQKNKQKKQIINDEYKMSKDLQQQQQPFNNDGNFVSLLTDNFAIMCQKGHG
eukprot:11342_1